MIQYVVKHAKCLCIHTLRLVCLVKRLSHSGITNPAAVSSTNLFPPNPPSVTPLTAFLKKKFPPFGTHKSLPKPTFPSPSSSRSTCSHRPLSAKLPLSTLVVRSPIKNFSSTVPVKISTSSRRLSSRQLRAVPHSEQNPRRPLAEEANSLKGAEGVLLLDEEVDGDGLDQVSWEGWTVKKWTNRLPECLRHWVHWHV